MPARFWKIPEVRPGFAFSTGLSTVQKRSYPFLREKSLREKSGAGSAFG